MKQKTVLVVGLGNPDEKYQNTFHNVGFGAVNRLAKKLGADFDKGECRALTAHVKKDGVKVIIAKPITYMNLSGESVRELVNKYKIEQQNCIIVYDDADLPVGKLRIRKEGSGGSHNGMLNVIANVGTQNVYRLRIGISRPVLPDMALMDYVLSKIPSETQQILDKAYDLAADALTEFCFGADIDKVMMDFNGKQA